MTRNNKSMQSDRARRRWQHAPALVVAIVALFAALSGAAVALPGQSTVTSGDIVNETIKSVDLKDGKAVAGADVEDETLTTSDVAPDTLTADDLAPNSVRSSEIPDQEVGSSELANDSVGAQEIGDGIAPRFNTVTVGGGTAENARYNTNTVTAQCLAGEELISGNAMWTGDADNEELFIVEVVPNHGGESVTVRGGNDSGDDANLVAVANCL